MTARTSSTISICSGGDGNFLHLIFGQRATFHPPLKLLFTRVRLSLFRLFLSQFDLYELCVLQPSTVQTCDDFTYDPSSTLCTATQIPRKTHYEYVKCICIAVFGTILAAQVSVFMGHPPRETAYATHFSVCENGSKLSDPPIRPDEFKRFVREYYQLLTK